MRKLLSADFSRLWKDKVFWGGMIFMIVLGIYLPVSNHMTAVKYGETGTLDSVFFTYASVIGILSAVLCSLFVGTEYNDGTIRNKVTAGHTRAMIYLSNLLVNTVSSLLLCLSFIIAASISGMIFTGFLRTDALEIIFMVFGTVMMVITFCAIFTFICMLNQSKSAVAVICILGVVVLFLASVFINARLNEPETYEGYIYADDKGEIITVGDEPNLNYVKGTQREIYKFLMEFLPTGQSLQYVQWEISHLWNMILYSGIITIVSTGAGVRIFRRKDIN